MTRRRRTSPTWRGNRDRLPRYAAPAPAGRTPTSSGIRITIANKEGTLLSPFLPEEVALNMAAPPSRLATGSEVIESSARRSSASAGMVSRSPASRARSSAGSTISCPRHLTRFHVSPEDRRRTNGDSRRTGSVEDAVGNIRATARRANRIAAVVMPVRRRRAGEPERREAGGILQQMDLCGKNRIRGGPLVLRLMRQDPGPVVGGTIRRRRSQVRVRPSGIPMLGIS